ncbi:galactokinase [Colwellia sp. E2M01]|uniref:galactokinase n=1 Tax=Colwellia sp. E2M01 TaxID=2841561 RepID=UPI001C09A9FD|nr:galactokinase [Colwellia sp. E2M01]MBU2872072.1 galactokinase [Colwellia sp. E2M01]
MDIIKKVKTKFLNHYSKSPAFIVNAPGRVNLIGEHTDYNDGFVLPCAIDFSTVICVSPRTDLVVNVFAIDCNEEVDSFDLNDSIAFNDTQFWSNYVRGVIDELKKRGFTLAGCDIAIGGNVPQGAGLSSSASLEVGIAATFNQLCDLGLSTVELAQISQAAENNFVGCACGIMDQLASACGKNDQALGIDCRSLELIHTPISDDNTIVIINSNVKRGLVDSEYNTRRQQCESGAEFFGKTKLRDVTIADFEAQKSAMDPLVAKRAEHILYENQRTLDAMEAFKVNDMPAISRLMAGSHASMRDLFEITTPEIDYLVQIIADVIGDRGGVRMTGGGFGGCIVAFVANDLVDTVVDIVAEKYEKQTGIKESIFITTAADGVSVITDIEAI